MHVYTGYLDYLALCTRIKTQYPDFFLVKICSYFKNVVFMKISELTARKRKESVRATAIGKPQKKERAFTSAAHINALLSS